MRTKSKKMLVHTQVLSSVISQKEVKLRSRIMQKQSLHFLFLCILLNYNLLLINYKNIMDFDKWTHWCDNHSVGHYF